MMPAAPTPSLAASRRWPMPPFIRASVGVHLAAAAAALAVPQAAWPALGAVALDHLLLGTVGLWPRSRWLGPNLTRLPTDGAGRGEVALTIDDGPDPEVTPPLLDKLDALGLCATFFCIAEQVRRHPALARRIVAGGHDLQNHSATHRLDFSLLGPRRIAAELASAQQTIAEATGRIPRFFRAPAGLRNPFLDPALHDAGLRLVSWTRRGFDTRQRDPARVLRRLERGLAGGDILLLHDGHAARDANGVPVVLEVLSRLAERLGERRLSTVTLAQAWPEAAAGEAADSSAAGQFDAAAARRSA